ncbi:hypothetical protein BT63DRAFT_395951 [Microthyrium microscopicum]|uniref:NTF2 domain-containing protein n=1 Tax=Microthyrium microscopicum TaxID=703497 RepID=A0A6A6UWG9_9PEZI|nr:hypothetical protein BT63DRAFT_395951 [Microthyrium microscopicum]
MTLLQSYTQFLGSPTPDVLADAATINYIPTLTTISEPAAIIKHLAAQAKVLTKKTEKVIHAFESDCNLCAEVETHIEFVTGGGALLPGLDDNFLADKTVVFPMIHIVQFDFSGKITQIRLYWDQASLLKNIEVIGSRGKNWPIRDGKDQLRLVAGGVANYSQNSAPSHSRRSTASKASNEGRSHASSVSTSANSERRNLHDILNQRDDSNEQTTPRKFGPGVAPRMSAKPASRDLADILAGQNEDFVPGSPSDRPVSPRKNSNGAKSGAGKNYRPMRLFDENEEAAKSPVKTNANPRKYNHFEFGDGEAAAEVKVQPRPKHASQWGFEDFTTPAKAPSKIQPHAQRTMTWSDDEGADVSPVQRPVVHHERPDSHAHFSITDEATPEPKRPSSKHNDALTVSQGNSVTEEEDPTTATKKQPLRTVTNVDLDHRNKDFGHHFEMADNSPLPARTTAPVEPNRARVVKGMGPNWNMYDQSPNSDSRKENQYRIKTGGDGMGGRKGAQPIWEFDDVKPAEPPAPRRVEKPKETDQGGRFWEF